MKTLKMTCPNCNKKHRALPCEFCGNESDLKIKNPKKKVITRKIIPLTQLHKNFPRQFRQLQSHVRGMIERTGNHWKVVEVYQILGRGYPYLPWIRALLTDGENTKRIFHNYQCWTKS